MEAARARRPPSFREPLAGDAQLVEGPAGAVGPPQLTGDDVGGGGDVEQVWEDALVGVEVVA